MSTVRVARGAGVAVASIVVHACGPACSAAPTIPAPAADVAMAAKPARPTRVLPEPACEGFAPREFDVDSLRQSVEDVFEQGGEQELRVVFEQLALQPLQDSASLPEGLHLIPRLERLDIDHVSIVSADDVVVQLQIVNEDGGWHSFRAQIYRRIGDKQYCPVLSPPASEEDLAGQAGCRRETRNQPIWRWSFLPLLEPERSLLVARGYTDAYDGDWTCPTGDIRRTLTFRAVADGELSAPLLTLVSRTTWTTGARPSDAQWAERESTFSVQGDFPRRVVVTERRTLCVGTDQPGCKAPKVSTSTSLYGFDGKAYSLVATAH